MEVGFLRVTSHESPATSHILSKGKCAAIRFKLGKGNHVNRIPRAAFEERAVGAFAGAQFAADAEQGINDDAAKRGVVLVRRPIHAIRDGAIFHASRRASASGAAFVDDRENMRFALPLRRRAGGDGRVLDDSSRLKFLDARSRIRHVEPPKMKDAKTYSC